MKTTLAMSFPKSLLLAFEAGYNGLANAKVQQIIKWGDFKTVIRQLNNDAAKAMYDTIVLDTADLAWDICEKFICAQTLIKDDNGLEVVPKSVLDIPWGKGSTALKKEFDSCIREIAMMGYGIVLISHELEKKAFNAGKDDKVKIKPTLNDNAKLIVNRFVDVIIYLRRITNPETGEEKRFMYTRDTDLYEAGSRFKYLEPKIEMTHDNLVNALCEAIEKQAELEQVKITDDFVNNYKEEVKKNFTDLMNEAKELWIEIKNRDEENCKSMNKIIEDVFGKPMKLSDAIEGQYDLIELTINTWKKEFNS